MNIEAESQSTFDPKNPHGFGDPDDNTLRKVEKDVLIPKIMRDRAKELYCAEEVKAFQGCCKDSNILMVLTCRKENSALKSCLAKWYENESFKEECKQIYLEERSEYRRTGLPKKNRSERV